MRKIILVVFISLLLMGCTKDRFPYQVHNIKATDCMYEINGDIINFTYVSNNPEGEYYRRRIFNGFCRIEDVKEYGEHYLWISTATITSGGIIYTE